MFKRILVPVDPSRPFSGANQYAVDLAHRFDSRLVATYIIDEGMLGSAGDEAASSLDHALEWVGQDAMEDFARAHEDLDVQKCLAYGPTATALFQVVLQSGADVVVVGGYHKGAAWGSTVSDVVQHAERPVFVVRRSGRLPGEGDRIVVPFDGSERPITNLVPIARFATETKSIVDLVNVAPNKAKDQALGVLEKGGWILDEHDVAHEQHVIPASFWRPKARSIVDYAKSVDAPLVAISRLGKTGMRTGHSRTVNWLAAHSDIPVWVVRK